MHVFRGCLSNFVGVLLSLFGIEGGMWVVIVLIPDHCLSIYFPIYSAYKCDIYYSNEVLHHHIFSHRHNAKSTYF